jgi:hypothetical protein
MFASSLDPLHTDDW